MLQDKIKHQLDGTLKKIDESKHIKETDKVIYRDLLEDAARNTNGVSQEEKLQGVTESVFLITQLLILDKLDNDKSVIWTVIERCKWAIVLVVAILSLLLLFRPELSAVITALVT